MPESDLADSHHPELTLEDVGRECPGWHCYAPGVNEFVYANLPGSFPLVIVRGTSPAGLRDEIRHWAGS